MALIYQLTHMTGRKLIGFECQRCLEEFSDQQDLNEMILWQHTGGYGSIHEDGTTLELVLCEACGADILGSFLIKNGEAQ